MKKACWIAFGMLLATTAFSQTEPNVIMTDVADPVEPGATFSTEVHFALDPGTELSVYQLAVGYDSEVVGFVSVEDIFGEEPDLFCVDAAQTPGETGGFPRAVLCFDTEIITPVIVPQDGLVAALRVTFRVLPETTVDSSQYSVLTTAINLAGANFETPLVADSMFSTVIDSENAVPQPGTVTIKQPIIPMDIDVQPGGLPNSINPRSRGVVPVAILGSSTFDVSDIDATTLSFGTGGAYTAHNLTDSFTYNDHLQDVNLDGFTDLVTHYRTQDTGIACGDDSVTLTGETTDGQSLEGSDSIRTVGCRVRSWPGIWMEYERRLATPDNDGVRNLQRKARRDGEP